MPKIKPTPTPLKCRKEGGFSAPLRVFEIKHLIKHTLFAAVNIHTIAFAICLTVFTIAKCKIDIVVSLCPFAAYTVIFVPLIKGTNGGF
jgi:hypothetical protein